MATSLIRSRAMITRAIDRKSWEEIPDGAVLQEDGTIIAIGTYKDLKAKHPKAPVLGSGNEILLPGFVNGHHHVGLTPVQLGSARHAARAVVHHAHGDPQPRSLSRHALFGLRDDRLRHHHGAAHPRLDARHASRGRGQIERGDPRLRGRRHARILLLRRARPEPARLPGRSGVRGEPAQGAAGADAALVRALQDQSRREHGAVPRPARAPQQQAAA